MVFYTPRRIMDYTLGPDHQDGQQRETAMARILSQATLSCVSHLRHLPVNFRAYLECLQAGLNPENQYNVESFEGYTPFRGLAVVAELPYYGSDTYSKPGFTSPYGRVFVQYMQSPFHFEIWLLANGPVAMP